MIDLGKKKIRPELIYGERAVQTAIKPKLSYSRRPKATENELIEELIQELLLTLNEQERTVVRLMELKEKTVKEVCKLTGWSESKVKVTKMRARKKLHLAMINLEKNPLKPLSSVGIAN
jgi:RNA polymerase sigma factor (sigma-70 family)